MNNKQHNKFLVFSSISENENYGKMFSQIVNNEKFFLMHLNNSFEEYKYGDDYESVLITLYLGNFYLIPSISNIWLSNYSKKTKDWNFKIPIQEDDIGILNSVDDFNIFMKLNLVKLVEILKQRKVKNFDFQLFLEDIELI